MTAHAAQADDQCVMVPLVRAARKLGVSPDTLKRAGEDGEVPVRRIRSVYVLPAAWLAWMTSWSPGDEAA